MQKPTNKSKVYWQDRLLNDRGFIAFTASFIFVFSLFYFSLIMLQSCYEVYDITKRAEYRIQGQNNLNFCLDYAKLALSKDHFISGALNLSLVCSIFFTREEDTVHVEASTTLSDIIFRGRRDYLIDDYEIK